MKEFRAVIIDYHDDYRNNYLTVEKWAEHNGIWLGDALILIEIMKKIVSKRHPAE